MMNDQPESAMSDPGDDSDDGLIRRQLAEWPVEDAPAEIAAQVLSRVGRRRRTLRAVRMGVGGAAVLAAALVWQQSQITDAPRTPLAERSRPGGESAIDTSPMSIANAHLVSLSATSPVVQFQLLREDQLAILHCLRSLEEEEL